MGVPVFEGFRRRNEAALSPWPDQIPEAAPEPPLEPDVYHVPRRFDPASDSAGYAPSWVAADLDPQRLDGRSADPPPVQSRRHRAGAPLPTADLQNGPAARPRPAETVRSLFREAARVRERPAPGSTEDARSLFPPAALDGTGLDVATRPRRSYPVRWPGTSRETLVRPEYHGVGVLRTAASAPGRSRTRGLGLLFPPHTVHARDSTSAATDDACELTGTDHVHIRQAVVAQDDALRSGRVREILARADPGDLRKALRELVEAADRSEPPRADRVAAVHEAETVQLGDHVLTRLDSRYVVERATIPAGALLAGSAELARRYVDLVAGLPVDPGALAEFLGDLVGAAANAQDDNVLGYADGLPEQPATVLGLFGMVTVDRTTSIMIGAGDGLPTGLRDPAPDGPP